MNLAYHIQEVLGGFKCCKMSWQHPEISPYGKSIDNYQDYCESLVRWQPGDEIQC